MTDYVANYFTNIPSLHRSLILVGGIAFFWCMESVFPLFSFPYNKWKHAAINLFFTLTTIALNFILAFILMCASQWAESNDFGLLNWIGGSPLFVQMLVGLMAMDLIGAYLAHWIEHKVDFLWRFHLVHHSDVYVDTTTANRHHPGESILRFAFTTLAVLLCGAPLWMVMLYQSVSVILSQFNHANIQIPANLDRWLSWIIVTPNMHHVHHHHQQPLTDRNYGNIFSFWDRFLGTYALAPTESLVYGIDSHRSIDDHSRLITLLLLPFASDSSAKESNPN